LKLTANWLSKNWLLPVNAQVSESQLCHWKHHIRRLRLKKSNKSSILMNQLLNQPKYSFQLIQLLKLNQSFNHLLNKSPKSLKSQLKQLLIIVNSSFQILNLHSMMLLMILMSYSNNALIRVKLRNCIVNWV